MARLILWKKPDDLVTLKNPDRKLPIAAVVCANGRPDLLIKLIKAGATHSLGEALAWAAGIIDDECLTILLEAGAKPTERSFWVALDSAYWEKVFLLLERKPALISAKYTRNGIGIEATALHIAMVEPVRRLPDSSVEVRPAPLEVIARLLSFGAPIDAQDQSGATPLMKAVELSPVEAPEVIAVVELLLKSGANPNSADRLGTTPLLKAIETKPSDAPEVVSVVKLLLESGANPNAADRWGTTALMMAAGRGATEIVTLLLDAGADSAVRNQAGQSAADYARLRGHDEIVARLTRP